MTNRRAVLAFGILTIAALGVLGPIGGVLARAESAPLALDIYTADSQGLGVTSTLIYGDQEAILVDTQFRIVDAEKLAAMGLGLEDLRSSIVNITTDSPKGSIDGATRITLP